MLDVDGQKERFNVKNTAEDDDFSLKQQDNARAAGINSHIK